MARLARHPRAEGHLRDDIGERLVPVEFLGRRRAVASTAGGREGGGGGGWKSVMHLHPQAGERNGERGVDRDRGGELSEAPHVVVDVAELQPRADALLQL